MHNKCNALKSSPNHPPTRVHGKTVFHEAGPWCQKCWSRGKREMEKISISDLRGISETTNISPAPFAAAKSFQSCLTLCDPIDSSLPGSSVPGILQARILERVAISFSSACMHAKSLQVCPALRPHGQQPTRLLRPQASPGKNSGVGCHVISSPTSLLLSCNGDRKLISRTESLIWFFL